MEPVPILLSHIGEEAITATTLKEALQSALPGVAVFVSSSEILLGSDWHQELNRVLRGARGMIALCSR